MNIRGRDSACLDRSPDKNAENQGPRRSLSDTPGQAEARISGGRACRGTALRVRGLALPDPLPGVQLRGQAACAHPGEARLAQGGGPACPQRVNGASAVSLQIQLRQPRPFSWSSQSGQEHSLNSAYKHSRLSFAEFSREPFHEAPPAICGRHWELQPLFRNRDVPAPSRPHSFPQRTLRAALLAPGTAVGTLPGLASALPASQPKLSRNQGPSLTETEAAWSRDRARPPATREIGLVTFLFHVFCDDCTGQPILHPHL
ncbi:hypothetical protein P7K49_032639 [Saguinus oedipus]|uniref:Uncharacterized protein n=1 Tax=Saguinus oedipus TaxID=9490 RepID=A0ABQ9TYT8_SAGOE|nr:hypothetical protein P7K49_032639 [Saguinus oedipus]